jgi:hypothetical protein
MPTKEWARIVQEEPTGEDPYACGYQAALSAVAQVLGTPPPASQSAPTNPAEIGSKSVVAPSDGGGELPEPAAWAVREGIGESLWFFSTKREDAEASAGYKDSVEPLYTADAIRRLAAPTPEQR